ncbi:hypothetical protein QFC20_003975 [Naganishia adeliensis]|uniref:Uncharacterized protein n=1 Tax=Naganishia adeliensis TaxID=92952 RepID=A0ACC2W5U4_9TREE|nr:hypothetical protein QFC20_003975 [Naganishia adeliensis]
MSDTEQQAKATTPEDVVMEEEDAPVTTNDQDVVPATDEEPAATEPEAKETNDKPAANEKPASSKNKSKAGQSARKESGTVNRKMGGKFAKADAKESNKGKYKVGDLCLGRVKGFPFWRRVRDRTLEGEAA